MTATQTMSPAGGPPTNGPASGANDRTPGGPRGAVRIRLVLALTVSSLLLAATAGGSWSVWPSSLLWAAPLLVAMRCLPWPVAVPLVVLVSAVGRAIAFGPSLAGADGLVLPLVASVALLPALVVDKLVDARFPRAGLLAWPLAITITERLVAATLIGGLVAPPTSIAAIHALRAGPGPWADTFFVALVAQAFGALGTVLHRGSDRFAAVERERGVRWAALTALVVSVIVFAGYALFRPTVSS